MTLRFLLDTDVVSEALRPRPDAEVLAQMHLHEGQLAIASPVQSVDSLRTMALSS